MNAVELFNNVAQAEGLRLVEASLRLGEKPDFSSSLCPPVQWLTTLGTVFYAGLQDRKCIWCDPFEHAAALYFLGDSGYKAFTIETHMEIFFCPCNDFRDMEWSFCRKEYVIDDTHLGPASSSRFKTRLFVLAQELSDGF